MDNLCNVFNEHIANTLLNMKNLFFILLTVLGISFTFQSCKEDIDLVGDYTETAVVYGILDQADSVHMIKITRAFIGPGDATQIAGIPDSNYFTTVTGTVKEFIGGSLARTFTLRDTIVNNKDENGIFYAPEQKLYYFTTSSSSPLIETAEYQLDLVINGGQFEVSGRTALVNGMSTTFGNPIKKFRFVDVNNEYASTAIPVSVGTAKQVNVTLNIEYTEWIGTASTVRSFDWTVGELEVSTGTQSFSANGQPFYSLIAESCSSDPNVDKRTLNSITTYITGGAEEFVNYMQVNEPSSSLAQSKPTYTNLTATEGHPVIGLFSSRNTLTVYKPFIDPGGNSNVRCLDKRSTERLCTGSITSPYLFCSDHPADIASNEAYVCN